MTVQPNVMPLRIPYHAPAVAAQLKVRTSLVVRLQVIIKLPATFPCALPLQRCFTPNTLLVERRVDRVARRALQRERMLRLAAHALARVRLVERLAALGAVPRKERHVGAAPVFRWSKARCDVLVHRANNIHNNKVSG